MLSPDVLGLVLLCYIIPHKPLMNCSNFKECKRPHLSKLDKAGQSCAQRIVNDLVSRRC